MCQTTGPHNCADKWETMQEIRSTTSELVVTEWRLCLIGNSAEQKALFLEGAMVVILESSM